MYRRCIPLVLAALVNAGHAAQDPPLAGLREVPFTDVQIRDSFWARRRETNRAVSLAHSLDKLEHTGAIANFDLAAAGKREGYHGPVYSDSDLYKTLEAVSYSLATDPDPRLAERLDTIIARVAAAQCPDGYLNTWYQVNAPEKRFTNLRDHHELYCAGHLFEAAAAHHQATGKRDLLEVATRYADLLCDTFGEGKRPGYCGHPEIELALVKLSRVAGQSRYFELARHFLDARGSKFFAVEHGTPLDKYNGEYWQDNAPLREQTRVVGHAVRFGYLVSAAVDIGAAGGDQVLLRTARRLWRNTTERNTYITGGIGPSASNEGFTTDYDLPNVSAYQETCASVAMVMWNHRLSLAYGDAKYADQMETALYNGLLAGVSLDGRRFFYVNPLASQGNHHRSEWFGCACCPPNVARTLAALGGYAYATDGRGLWVNLYIQGSVRTVVGGKTMALALSTDYPWNGEITITVDLAPETSCAINLRIPGWCSGASASINGQTVANPEIQGGYLRLDRAWRTGDAVRLNLPMPVRQVDANPNIAANRGRLAIARGPLVYCVEAVDVEAPLSALAILAGATLSASKHPDLLGGVVVISGEALVSAGARWDQALYRTALPPERVAFTAIPYYAWDNRAAGPMQVWVPTTPPPARSTGAEAEARVSISYRSQLCEPEAIHDGAEVRGSSENPTELCHWWPHKGGTEWVSYSWDLPQQIAGCSVYWFDDTGKGQCRLPQSWRVLYKSGDEWRPVDAEGAYPMQKDGWCEVRFAAVTTVGLKLELKLEDSWSAGIHEWRIHAPQPD